MKATQPLVVSVLVSTACFSLTATAAPPGKNSESLIAQNKMRPSPGSIFLSSFNGNKTVTPGALLGNGGLGAAKGLHKKTAFPLADCENIIDDDELITYGGGNAQDGASGSGSLNSGSNSIPLGDLSIGQGNAGPGNTGTPGAGGGGGSAGNGAGGGDNGSNDGSADADPQLPGSNNTPPPDNGSAGGSDTLVNWNIVPGDSPQYESSGSDGVSDDSGGAAHMPLPAPVWMALAGLTIVVALRRRLLP